MQVKWGAVRATEVRQSAIHRLNAVCPYFTMFPVSFPLRVLRRAKPGDWVLDPFCGRGTTLFAGRLLGLGAVGIDTSVLAASLAEAKLVTPRPLAVARLAEALAHRPPEAIPRGTFWRRCYHPRTLKQVCAIREGLLSDSSATAAGLRAVMLGILHGPRLKTVRTYLSNQMPRTYATKPSAAVRYWEARGLTPEPIDVVQAVGRRATFTFSDMPPSTAGEVWHGDAVGVLKNLRRRFDWIVTSPPYLGMRSYTADQWLRNWFLGGPPEVDYQNGSALATADLDDFVPQLAEVWTWCGMRAAPGARLIVRFGALPSVSADPKEVIGESLRRSEVSWRISRMLGAGLPRSSARQATQFAEVGRPVEEIDCYAVLRA